MISEDNRKIPHAVILSTTVVKILNFFIRLTARVTNVIKNVISIENAWENNRPFVSGINVKTCPLKECVLPHLRTWRNVENLKKCFKRVFRKSQRNENEKKNRLDPNPFGREFSCYRPRVKHTVFLRLNDRRFSIDCCGDEPGLNGLSSSRRFWEQSYDGEDITVKYCRLRNSNIIYFD